MNKQSKQIHIVFGWRIIVFFMLLELLTVPPVAMSNSFVIGNMWHLAGMGFVVALLCIFILLQILKKLVIRNSQQIFALTLLDIKGLWYIALLSGVLLMVMFIVQYFLFEHGFGDFSTGFISAFISVGVTLVAYKLSMCLGLAIKLIGIEGSYSINFTWINILRLAIIFGIYEFVVCPITGIWILHPEHRLILAIASGIGGGFCGGVAIAVVSRYVRMLQISILLT